MKLRGQRVELGEIEAALLSAKAVTEARPPPSARKEKRRCGLLQLLRVAGSGAGTRGPAHRILLDLAGPSPWRENPKRREQMFPGCGGR